MLHNTVVDTYEYRLGRLLPGESIEIAWRSQQKSCTIIGRARMFHSVREGRGKGNAVQRQQPTHTLSLTLLSGKLGGITHCESIAGGMGRVPSVPNHTVHMFVRYTVTFEAAGPSLTCRRAYST